MLREHPLRTSLCGGERVITMKTYGDTVEGDVDKHIPKTKLL